MLIKLPSGITWKDKISKSSGEVNFNPRANELTWNVKAIEPGVGYDKPVEELLFQIAVNPQVNQTINDIKLINSITLNGYEEFIEEKIYLQKDGFEINNVSENGF